MMTRCNRHVELALDLAERLQSLADASSSRCDHDGCLILGGVLRDCAYKIRSEAERCGRALPSVRAARTGS